MKFKFIFEDNTEKEIVASCFGASGRVDWNGCNLKHRQFIVDRSNEFRIYTPSSDYKASRVKDWSGTVKVTHIAITAEDVFRNIFHASMKHVLDYIVHRSIWAPLFDKTADEIFKANEMRMRVDVLPSEIQTSLHIWLRDSLSIRQFGETFSQLSKALGNEDLAFAVSLAFPWLSTGNQRSRIGCEGISNDFNFLNLMERDCNELSVIPLTMQEVHGYVMNVTRVWYQPFKDGRRVTARDLLQLLNNKATGYTVKGIFGDVRLEGIQDPALVVKQFFKNKGVL